jgi:hypothetical protein
MNSDYTIGVRCDNDSIGLLDNLEVWHGVPGAKIKIKKDARVLVGFHECNPTKPYAALFGVSEVEECVFMADTFVLAGTTIKLDTGEGSPKKIARVGDSVKVTVPAGQGVAGASDFFSGAVTANTIGTIVAEGEITSGSPHITEE